MSIAVIVMANAVGIDEMAMHIIAMIVAVMETTVAQAADLNLKGNRKHLEVRVIVLSDKATTGSVKVARGAALQAVIPRGLQILDQNLAVKVVAAIVNVVIAIVEADTALPTLVPPLWSICPAKNCQPMQEREMHLPASNPKAARTRCDRFLTCWLDFKSSMKSQSNRRLKNSSQSLDILN
jgi:hypothetical protein